MRAAMIDCQRQYAAGIGRARGLRDLAMAGRKLQRFQFCRRNGTALRPASELARALAAHINAPRCTRCTAPLAQQRSEEHTSELQSLMRISYAVFCLKKKKQQNVKQIKK